MAGVPSVFQAMVATVLPTLTGGAPLMSRTLRIDRGEGDIAGPLGALAAEFSDLSIWLISVPERRKIWRKYCDAQHG